jgi:hypothetical protein
LARRITGLRGELERDDHTVPHEGEIERDVDLAHRHLDGAGRIEGYPKRGQIAAPVSPAALGLDGLIGELGAHANVADRDQHALGDDLRLDGLDTGGLLVAPASEAAGRRDGRDGRDCGD